MTNKFLFVNPHPHGMWMIALSAFFFTTGIASIVNAFVPYATNTLLINSTQAQDISLVAFLFLFNFAAVAGGTLGYFYNHKRSVIAGGLFSTIGLALISIENLALIGVSTYCIGVGLILPNLYTILSQLYARTNPKRLSAFMIFYLAGNIGYFFNTALADLLPKYIGFEYFFILSSLFTLIGTYIFMFNEQDFRIKPGIQLNEQANKHTYHSLFTALVILTLIARLCLQQWVFSILIILAMSIFSLGMLFYLARRGQPGVDQPRTPFFIFVIFICSAFWLANRVSLIAFNQYEHLILQDTLFNVSEMPSNILYAINVFIIALVGIYLSILWHKRKQQTSVRTILKLCGIALVLASVALYLFWVCATQLQLHLNLRSVILVVSALIISVSEVLLAPIYFATAAKFAPRRYESIIIGIQQLFIGLTGCIAVALTYQSMQVNALLDTYSFEWTLPDSFLFLAVLTFLIAMVTFASNYVVKNKNT